MSILTTFIIAVGLAIDAFAVSVSAGCIDRQLKAKKVLRMALFFGIFQAVMPVIGWLIGKKIADYITEYDHWIAFGLLAGVGIKMIYESFKLENKRPLEMSRIDILLLLSIATSIDALVIGFSLSLLKIAVIIPAIIIGIVTFIFSLTGVYIGKRFGHFFENKIELIGGLILIGIGLKILIEHILAI